eukprot:CAMPEP_0181467842 /NCGR_PEP_ID=MMETSP1110-20121109/37190_1 /TAXON_ID=174948 /ORGANISM="Symbiodinium sp., Strain CCMP421" /LENGTH=87 /DNA_ID=CAMNT_0023592687 /DNA_START=510 /DNA_END=772 /DNA_ORIENTATION=+
MSLRAVPRRLVNTSGATKPGVPQRHTTSEAASSLHGEVKVTENDAPARVCQEDVAVCQVAMEHMLLVDMSQALHDAGHDEGQLRFRW